MFLDHKKFAVAYSTEPTIANVNASELSEKANEGLQEVRKVFDTMLANVSEIISTLKTSSISLVADKPNTVVVDKGNELEITELQNGQRIIAQAKTQIANVLVGEYNTLSAMSKGTRLESKVAAGFEGITTKSVRMAGEMADFVTDVINDYRDGIESTDDKSEFLNILVTRLYVITAKITTLISDVCYDTERMAMKLLSGLS